MTDGKLRPEIKEEGWGPRATHQEVWPLLPPASHYTHCRESVAPHKIMCNDMKASRQRVFTILQNGQYIKYLELSLQNVPAPPLHDYLQECRWLWTQPLWAAAAATL